MVFKYLVDTYKSVSKQEDENRINSLKNLLVNEALSCAKCNSLSVPIYSTANKYRCVGCGRQFSGSYHHIHVRIESRYHSESTKFYRLAVEKIKK